jgi:hypothetical protein
MTMRGNVRNRTLHESERIEMHNNLIMRDVPNDADWGDLYSDPDAFSFYEIFFGKNQKEAYLSSLELFKIRKHVHLMDILAVPSKVFVYYFPSLAYSFLDNYRDIDDLDEIASTLIAVVESVVKREGFIGSQWPVVRNAILQISENEADYGVDEEIFGNLKNRVLNILKTVEGGGSD